MVCGQLVASSNWYYFTTGSRRVPGLSGTLHQARTEYWTPFRRLFLGLGIRYMGPPNQL